jgi:glycosyltransferase involved in cell wall biosynthesis
MIVYRQRRDWFLTCLDSVVNQSCKPEVIVSGVRGDKALEWAKLFPTVKIVDNSFADPKVQINNGLKFADGKYVVHVGSDDYYYPKSIETMLNVAHEKDAVIVYPGLHYCDENLNVIFKWEPPPEFSVEKLKQSCFMTDSSLVKKSVLWEFGFFDPKWRKFAIWDMWFKIAEKYPYSIFPSNHILCKYRRHRQALGIQAFHGNAEATGENLRGSFYEKRGITNPVEVSRVDGVIKEKYEIEKFLLDI